MKRVILCSFVLLLFAAPQVHAAIVAHDDVTVTNPAPAKIPTAGGGGPFEISVHPDFAARPAQGSPDWVGTVSATDTFATFCVEFSEHLSFGSRYDVSSITGGSLATGRTLSGYAAWVFDQYLSVTAPLVNLTSGQLGLYQQAIWAGMTSGVPTYANIGSATSEYANAGSPSGAFDKTTGGIWGSVGAGASLRDISLDNFLASKVAWTGFASTDAYALSFTNNYKVLNLQDDIGGPGHLNQDLLVQPSATLAVPEPASIVVWSLLAGGAAGIGVARKRRQMPTGRWSDESRQAIFAVVERTPLNR